MGTAAAFREGMDGAEAWRQQRDAEQEQRRAATAALYWNAMQTPLPKPDDPKYKDALQRREDLLKGYISQLGPEQHATIGDRLHALIFGPEHTKSQQAQKTPVSSQAPLVPGSIPPGKTAPAPEHPFAHNPVYSGILKGLEALGSHLKAAAHPLPAPPPIDYAALAAAWTPEEREFAQKQQLQQEAEAARLAEAKARGAGNANMVKWNAAAQNKGYTDFDEAPPDVQLGIIRDVAALTRAPQKPTFEWNQAGHLIAISPAPDGSLTTREILDTDGNPVGKFNPTRVSRRNGFYYFTDKLGKIHQVAVSTETENFFQPMVDASPQPPVSSQAPSLDAANAKIAAANATSKKLNKGGPVSRNAPQFSSGADRIIGDRGGPLLKVEQAEYGKAVDDARTAKAAYQEAAGLLADSARVSDLPLVMSWIKASNAKGFRLSNIEIQQAYNSGSLETRFRTAIDKARQGRLAPEVEAQALRDIQRAYHTAQSEADLLKTQLEGGAPQSSQAPVFPGAAPSGSLWDSLPDAGGPQ